MKIKYEKPIIEFEDYELNASIAAGCTVIVNVGPREGCTDYGEEELIGAGEEPIYANFYEDSCSCYLTAGHGPIYTS